MATANMARAFCLLLAIAVLSIRAFGQQVDGAAIYGAHCSQCHDEGKAPRAPGREALRLRRPESVIDALVSGPMRLQGARLSGPERRAVAEFLTGRSVGGDVAGTSIGRCSTASPPADPARGPVWNGWGGSPRNKRFQPAEQAGLTPVQVLSEGEGG